MAKTSGPESLHSYTENQPSSVKLAGKSLFDVANVLMIKVISN